MPLFFVIKMILSSYFKQFLFTVGAVIAAIFLSFYLLGWWGILSSIIIVPIIVFYSIVYIINEIKKNPMMMFQSMVMGTPGVGSVMAALKENNMSMDDVSSMLMKSSNVFKENKFIKNTMNPVEDIEDVDSKDIIKVSENLKTKTAN